MSIEKVKAFFRAYSIETRIQEFTVSSATVELAAAALHCPPGRIAKTLAFLANGNAILVVAAGDTRIDNAKYKAQCGIKAKMMPPSEAAARIGHAVGGVCPFAIPAEVPVYLDISLRRFSTVFPACGSSNSAIELAIDELEHFSSPAAWVDVCKGWTK